MATNFRVKIGKIADSFSFVTLAFQNGLEYRHSDYFKKFSCDNLAILCANLMNFGPVTSELNIAKDIHPVVSFFKINISDKLSRDPPDRFSPHFHRMVSI